MFKKIFAATLLAIMISGLVYGAWYRTQARTANESAATNEQHRRETSDLAQSESTLQQGGGYRSGNNSQSSLDSAAGGQGQMASEATRSRRGVGGQQSAAGGNGSSTGEQSRASQPGNLPSSVSFAGSVESVAADLIVVTVAGQTPIEIAGRALSYASEQGFVFHQGDLLALTGFYEDSDFEVQTVENLTTGQSLALREQNGRPLWAGGRGGGGGRS